MKTIMQSFKIRNSLIALFMLAIISACETTPAFVDCSVNLKGPLASATRVIEDKLVSGCEYSFDSYLAGLIDIAIANPTPENKKTFSDFLVRVSDQGTISKRQAKGIYNRYFNVKFVSLEGDYNTCSQVCPVRSKVLAEMSIELMDKEMGLMQASEDASSYYRADHLLKEAEIVLEATCRACSAGGI